MMGVVGIWHGSDGERDVLNAALVNNCTCTGAPGYVCPAHAMLLDSRVLDHLVFVRRNVAVFVGAEFSTGDERE